MQKSKYGYVPISGYLQKKILNISEFYSSEILNFIIKEYESLIDSSK